MQAEVQKWRKNADTISETKRKFADPNSRVV